MIFKVLTYGSVLVDESMLFQGIYSTTEPKLYDSETTIESLIEYREFVGKMLGQSKFPRFDFSIENLKKCTLTKVMLTIQEGELASKQINNN